MGSSRGIQRKLRPDSASGRRPMEAGVLDFLCIPPDLTETHVASLITKLEVHTPSTTASGPSRRSRAVAAPPSRGRRRWTADATATSGLAATTFFPSPASLPPPPSPPPPPPASNDLAVAPRPAAEEPTTFTPRTVDSPFAPLRAHAVLVPACCVAGDAVAARCASSCRTEVHSRVAHLTQCLCSSLVAGCGCGNEFGCQKLGQQPASRNFESDLLPLFEDALVLL